MNGFGIGLSLMVCTGGRDSFGGAAKKKEGKTEKGTGAEDGGELKLEQAIIDLVWALIWPRHWPNKRPSVAEHYKAFSGSRSGMARIHPRYTRVTHYCYLIFKLAIKAAYAATIPVLTPHARALIGLPASRKLHWRTGTCQSLIHENRGPSLPSEKSKNRAVWLFGHGERGGSFAELRKRNTSKQFSTPPPRDLRMQDMYYNLKNTLLTLPSPYAQTKHTKHQTVQLQQNTANS
ncbi:hypothetical protein C8J57DRAFT_1254022 [Mycena rebaudengoi]|nr:hypothetical protein C8J57DRAFT_1254022 [Mycena rebaudengoi]